LDAEEADDEGEGGAPESGAPPPLARFELPEESPEPEDVGFAIPDERPVPDDDAVVGTPDGDVAAVGEPGLWTEAIGLDSLTTAGW
jgi:hypothetical protein